MSQAVKAAMLASKDLGKNERLVVLAIAAHTNQAGDAWPSVATIADYVGCSERTVQRTIAKLVPAGRLFVRKAAGISTHVYRLVPADRSQPAASSFVYFIDYGATVRIGYSKSPAKRLAQLKEEAGRKDLRLIAIEPGGDDWKAFLHAEFAGYRVGRSEQFLKTPMVMEYIGSLAGGAQ
ncbi:helix-turn-helix domain-containing protein [Micromonospora sp. NPDC048999]|uniref:helix-turn-helix domain-containing protein n=1 Tax=Micromonospora sp. NPDC048999 TaxID=3155391 RepID=UPI0033D7D9FD